MIPSVFAVESAEPFSGLGPGTLIGIAIGLLLLAFVFFFMEALFPSMGLLTLIGIGSLVAALAAGFGAGTVVGIVFVGVTVVMVPTVIVLGIKVFRKSLILRDTDGQTDDAGAAAAPPPVGARGVALTTLRPSGSAQIAGRKYSVVTTGDMVEAKEQIEVVALESTRVVVKPVRV